MTEIKKNKKGDVNNTLNSHKELLKKIKGGNILSKFVEDLRKLYDVKKRLQNPPKYLKTLREYLELEGISLEDENEG